MSYFNYVNPAVQNLFPRVTAKGKKLVIAEMCRCKHGRESHAGESSLAAGHGACQVADCNCNQYSWASNVERSNVVAQKAGR